jgi:uncharacterized protein YcsI (UPF0317 family)
MLLNPQEGNAMPVPVRHSKSGKTSAKRQTAVGSAARGQVNGKFVLSMPVRISGISAPGKKSS